jgi:hypothetical protein
MHLLYLACPRTAIPWRACLRWMTLMGWYGGEQAHSFIPMHSKLDAFVPLLTQARPAPRPEPRAPAKRPAPPHRRDGGGGGSCWRWRTSPQTRRGLRCSSSSTSGARTSPSTSRGWCGRGGGGGVGRHAPWQAGAVRCSTPPPLPLAEGGACRDGAECERRAARGRRAGGARAVLVRADALFVGGFRG